MYLKKVSKKLYYIWTQHLGKYYGLGHFQLASRAHLHLFVLHVAAIDTYKSTIDLIWPHSQYGVQEKKEKRIHVQYLRGVHSSSREPIGQLTGVESLLLFSRD